MEILDNLFTLFMLVALQAVLGFDNLLYISLESKNAPAEKRSYVRKLGIGIAIALRIVLLFVLLSLIDSFQNPIFHFPESWGDYVKGHFNVHSLIVLLGGVFIIYTAIKEIWHMMHLEEHAEDGESGSKKSVGQVITMIVIMNIVFSFDSILSAIALTDVFWVMAVAIIIGGLLMIFMADKISDFLAKNRMYEVLGLFILFLVGIMLVTEGGHLAHISMFGEEITQMSKSTFYFILVILILTDVAQGRYQKNLMKAQERAKKNQA